jgi:hypothetical protein
MKWVVIIFFTLCSSLFAQSTFCDGWDDGYAAGKKMLNDDIYITPICPIPSINEDNYQRGYVRGYERATGVTARVVTPNDQPNTATFCDGWEKGFESAMVEYNKGIYIVPICPIARINEDNYQSGYERGYSRGLENLGVERNNNVIVYDEKWKTFCDGWQEGYDYGLQEWATANSTTKPLKITPICPIPGMNEDNYMKGFELGRARAKEDLD